MTRSTWLIFIALSIVWGLPYFLIKIALTELSPGWVAFSRVAIGALVLTVIVPRADWRLVLPRIFAIAVIAVLDISLPFFLIATGERSVTSSLTGLLLSAMPIAVTLLALALDRNERLGKAQIAGLVIGIAGVAALLGVTVGRTRAELAGVALIMCAVVAYSLGVIAVKHWFRGLPMLASTAAMLCLATLASAPTALLEPPTRFPSLPVVAAMIVLGALCTSAAYIMYFTLIARAGAIRASVVTYINPAVAAVLGVALLHESLSVTAIAGLLLIILGSWLSTGGPRAASDRGHTLSRIENMAG